MAAHSPLPWRVTEPNVPDGIAAGIASVDGWTIADTYCDVEALSREVGVANAHFAVRAANAHEALLSALKECSFRLAALVVAAGEFTDINKRALDAAASAIDAAESR